MRNITQSFFNLFCADCIDKQDLYFEYEADKNENDKDGLTDIKTELIIIQNLIKRMMANTFSSGKPILNHGENPIIFPNTINVIFGPAETHTRRLVETLCSILLSSQAIENNLGFTKNKLNHFQLLYVDTKRNIRNKLAFAIQQIVARAGYPTGTPPSNFSFMGLEETDRESRFEALRLYIRCKHAEPNYHLFIVLDVSNDCIQDSDNPEHVRRLINFMKDAVNNSNCTFFCIHENSESEKPKELFEYELMNISSTIMQSRYDKSTDSIEVKLLKPSNTEKPVSIFCKYDDDVKGLVLAKDSEEEKSVAQDVSPGHDLPF